MLGSPRPVAAQTCFARLAPQPPVVLALILSTPVNAADLSMPFKAPPPAPAFSWTGFYIAAEVWICLGQGHHKHVHRL